MRALLVPVKSFAEAKHRLSPVLAPAEREALVRLLATGVLHSSRGLSTYVCCDDEDVAAFARDEGAEVLWTPGLGLSRAVTTSVETLARRGVDLVVVAHGDLPFIDDLSTFGEESTVTLAPDRRLDGTNVAAVPADSGFVFSYGAGSFARHRDQAAALGLGPAIVYDGRLALDIDYPEDLELLKRGVDPTTLERGAS